MFDLDFEPFDETTLKLIHQTVRQMIGRGGYRPQDQEDLIQEFKVRLLKRLAAYRTERGEFHAFVRTILKRESLSLLRDQQALKRNQQQVLSLQSMVTVEDGCYVDLAATLEAVDGRRRLGTGSRPQAELMDLVLELDKVIETLPEPQRRLAEQLKLYSISEIARLEGISRSTVYQRIRSLLQPFQHAGLDQYLSRKVRK